MVTLTNPVNAQNIIDRFADYVVATANAGIVYHTTNKPFTEFDVALGSVSGIPIGISGANAGTTEINASTIYNVLVGETVSYTRIKNIRARLLISTGAGNRTRPATDAKDLTGVAHLSSSAYSQSIGTPSNNGVVSTAVISANNLESFFGTLRTAYNTARDNTIELIYQVCHSSCHASCHGSRGRR